MPSGCRKYWSTVMMVSLTKDIVAFYVAEVNYHSVVMGLKQQAKSKLT